MRRTNGHETYCEWILRYSPPVKFFLICMVRFSDPLAPDEFLDLLTLSQMSSLGKPMLDR